MEELYQDSPVDPFDAPIPGESLTNATDNRQAWEQPPEFTDVNEAIQETFLAITEGETYIDIMDSIRGGTNIADLTQVILFKGYTKGKWNTDLMVLLVEPIMYVLIALAEHNGIYDYKVYEEEDTDMEDGEIVELINDDINRMTPKRTKLNQAITKKPEDVLEGSLLAQIKEAPVMGEQ